MEGLYVFNVIIWLIAGAVTLASNKIEKFSYVIVWIVLMINLIGDCIKAFMI